MKIEALTSVTSMSMVLVVLALCGIIPSGMRELMPSSVTIIITRTVSLPIISLAI